MAFSINTFRSTALNNAGARANLFDAIISGSAVTAFGLSQPEFKFACKSAQIPAMTVGVIEVPYFGRTVKVPGNKTFENWSVTIINDEDFNLRNGFEKWMAAMGTHEGNISTINAGDGTHEPPTQALLDSYSIKEKLGTIKGKKIVIVGDILHSRVALSNIFALKLQGAEVKVCGPTTLIPKYITSLGVEVETNIKKALEWCDVANVLRVQHERMDINYFPSTREYTQLFGINKQILDNLGKKIVIMHPGPINRGVEITSDVADSNQSIILNQVENGVAVRMAVIYLLAQQVKR